MSEHPLVGREKTLNEIKSLISLRRHLLLTGDIGVGKTTLLRELNRVIPNSIYVERIEPFKEALLAISESLHEEGRLCVEGIEASYLKWPDIRIKLERFSTKELVLSVSNSLNERLLILDHLEAISASNAFYLSHFFKRCTIIAAACDLSFKAKLPRLYFAFEPIEIGPLDKAHSLKLLRMHTDYTNIKDKALFESQALSRSNGNPLAIVEMAQRTLSETFDDTSKIRLLTHPAGRKELSLAPIFLFIGAFAVAVRFIALGLNDVDLYILAGTFGAFFLVVRYFIYRSMRRG